MNNTDFLFQNIDALNSDLRIITEEYSAHIADLAHLLYTGNDPEAYADARERLAQSILLAAGGAADCNRSEVQDVFGIVDIIASALLSSEITKLGLSSIHLSELFPPYNESASRITYFRTHGADEAYSAFAKILPFPTVSYVNGFSSVCDEVFSGYSDFGILPIKSGSNGRMSTVDKLIRKFSLFTVATFDIFEDNDTLTFALLAKSQVMLDGAFILDIDYTVSDGFSLTSLLCSLSLMGIYPDSCEMVNSLENYGDTVYRLTFKVTEESAKQLISCLDREYSDFSVNGFYKTVTKNGTISLQPSKNTV